MNTCSTQFVSIFILNLSKVYKFTRLVFCCNTASMSNEVMNVQYVPFTPGLIAPGNPRFPNFDRHCVTHCITHRHGVTHCITHNKPMLLARLSSLKLKHSNHVLIPSISKRQKIFVSSKAFGFLHI